MTELTIGNRVSGYRIEPISRADYEQKIQTRIAALMQNFGEVLRLAMEAPYCFDDAMRALPPDVVWRRLLESGEILFGMDGSVPGSMHVLSNIRAGRHCDWATITFPQYRGTGATAEWMKLILNYAFSPLSPQDGLGLKKVKTMVSVMNTPALKVSARLNPVQAGFLQNEGLFNGNLSHMVLFEFGVPQLIQGEAVQPPTDSVFESVGTAAPAPIITPVQPRVHTRHQEPVIQQIQRREGPGQIRHVMPDGSVPAEVVIKPRSAMQLMEHTGHVTQLEEGGSRGGIAPASGSGESWMSVDAMMNPKYWQQKGFDVEVT